jgi:predicted TIM-barrel fold metal-dependent hydrolase
MTRFDVISADSHFIEPPELWTSYVDARFRDRVPHLERLSDTDVYWIGEEIKPSLIGLLAGAGRTAGAVRSQGRWDEDIPRSAYDAGARVEAIAADGVQAEVLYPSVCQRLYGLRDPELMYASFEAYNSWAADWARQDREHFRVLGVLAVDDVARGTRELIRCKESGLAGALIPAVPAMASDYTGAAFDRFWDAAQETGLPISLHISTRRDDKEVRGASFADASMKHTHVMRTLDELIFGGVFLRFPDLRVVSAENDAGWAAHLIARMDHKYRHSYALYDSPIKGAELLPSDYFRRNVFLTFMIDQAGVQTRHLTGVDNLMWASDYPHHESTWPHSGRVIADHFPPSVPEAEKRQIVAGNAARLYGFS